MKSIINNIKEKIKLESTSLKFKIWIYLIVFSILILTFVWLFQIIFLNTFYENAKIRELNKAVSELVEKYNDKKLYESIDFIARDNGICVQIMVGNTITYDSSTFNRGCMPNSGPINYKNSFLLSGEKQNTYRIINPKYNNEVLIKAIKLSSNTYIFASISLEPIDSAIGILKNQFIIVTIIVLIFALLISFFISQKLSRPIEKINKSAMDMKNGNYNTTFEIDENILELKELANTLKNTSNELNKTEELRKELMANVSHDLKTPLTMIKAYAEMIRDLSYKDKQKTNEHLNIIIEETDRLNLLVNDILELSVLQSDSSYLNIEKFDLILLIKTILNRYDILKENKGYIFNFDENNKIMVEADKTRIEQVIYNLLNNAVNYTGVDKIININIEEQNDVAIVKISDTGKGIKKEDIDLIWKKYYKVDKSHKRNKIGTGIGLSIVENILVKHKFKFGVESIRGKGTTFWFEIKKDT